MKLVLRKDTAKRIVERLLLDASKLELRHGTVSGESFTVRPVTLEREILRLRRSALASTKAGQGRPAQQLEA